VRGIRGVPRRQCLIDGIRETIGGMLAAPRGGPWGKVLPCPWWLPSAREQVRAGAVPKRPFAHQHLPRGIHAYHMQDRLCHVAPQYARIFFHRTRRLLSGIMVSNAASVWLLEAMLPTQGHGMSADQSGIHHGIKWLSGAMPRPHETDKAFPLHTGSMGRLGHAQQSRGRRPILTIRDNNYATSTTTVGPCCVPAQSHPQGQ